MKSRRMLELRVIDVLRHHEGVCPSRLFGFPTVRIVADALNVPHIAVGVACRRLMALGVAAETKVAGTVRLTPPWAVANDRSIERLAPMLLEELA